MKFNFAATHEPSLRSVRWALGVVLALSVSLGVVEAAANSADLPGGVKPWDGDGVTAAWNAPGTLQIVSGDRHWILDVRSTDPSQWSWSLAHRFTDYCGFWRNSGDPAPWSASGVTAAWQTGDHLVLVSVDRYWTVNSSRGRWEVKGKLLSQDPLWKAAPRGRTGGAAPWDLDGVTAAWILGNGFTAVSRDKYWTFDTSTGRWSGSGFLADNPVWAAAPRVASRNGAGAGQLPWEGKGITAAYTLDHVLAVFSGDKYWVLDMSDPNWRRWRWAGAGRLEDVPLWADAPLVCDRFAGFKPDCRVELQDFSIFEFRGYVYVSAIRRGSHVGLQYARSKDMVAWEDLGSILPTRGPHDPDSTWAPHVFQKGGTYYQYYTGAKTVGPMLWDQKILLATTTDPSRPGSWKKSDLVFTPDHPGALWVPGSGAACRDPMVLQSGGKWHLYYTGYDHRGGVTQGIVGRAEATSPAGPWTDRGAVLAVSEGAPESAFVVPAPDGSFIMTFNHSKPDGSGGSRLARSTSPSGPFVVEGSFGPGWAHEWLRRSDGSWLSGYLTGYWVNVSGAHWGSNRLVVE